MKKVNTMAYQFIQELTDDWKTEFRVPCHIYVMDGSKCVGYIKEGTTKIDFFSVPWTYFDKRHRKFKKLLKKEVVNFA